MKNVLAFTLLWAMALPLQAGEVTIEVTNDTLTFKIGKAIVTHYQIGASVAKPYFYPLNAPGEVCVTRGWPMVKGLPKETADHVHQKSAWFCHGDIIPEGVELKTRSLDKNVKGVDFWSEGLGHGKIICVEVGKPLPGKNSAAISTKNEWKAADGTKILDETRTIALHDLGAARLVVLEIDLFASVCPLTFGDTKEGSMGVRVNDEIIVKNGGNFENAGGKLGEKEVWGHKSPWCDYFGKIGEQSAGIALFEDPGNTQKACWHARAYGLMAANPFGRSASGFPEQKGKTDLVKMAKGDHLKFRYGLLLHQGDTREGKVAGHFKTFVELNSK
jgi:Family of unknown function (DUF6807)